ncbi:hypothetical protein [Lysobacter xanthus]
MTKPLKHLAVVALLLVGGCATLTAPTPKPAAAAWTTPEEAVLKAAHAAPAGVQGTFAMRVRGVGTRDGRVYLNSEQDYRDQRTLTVALTPDVARELCARIGVESPQALEGRDILVSGTAMRTRIFFLVNGRATDKYYYQTHVNVDRASQITLR